MSWDAHGWPRGTLPRSRREVLAKKPRPGWRGTSGLLLGRLRSCLPWAAGLSCSSLPCSGPPRSSQNRQEGYPFPKGFVGSVFVVNDTYLRENYGILTYPRRYDGSLHKRYPLLCTSIQHPNI